MNEATKLDDGGQAFPSEVVWGMSLRDYFAGQAIVGLLARLSPCVINGQQLLHEDAAYVIADAMIAAKKRK